ncbi:hypothetical protein [Actinoplanes sp. NPDC051859]|uniref:hypothetical protein n=1 Tax=Actinoplanes sp. NPDC051859 TaxID=3363909 RepID=UPI0037AB1E8E
MTALEPGITLGAAEALRHRRGQSWSDAQVAYLVHLAYETGRLHGYSEDVAETVACWEEHAEPRRTRAARIASRVAEMTEAARANHRRLDRPEGYEYTGGPVDWETGMARRRAGQALDAQPSSLHPAEPHRSKPQFPNLAEQAAWLSSEDIAFCRRYARSHHGATR